MDKRILWLIDDDESELKTYRLELQNLMPDGVHIEAILPLPNMKDCSTKILSDKNTASIVIDEKLKKKGHAAYWGIDLAKSLRSIDSKVPIYILTNYVDDEEFEGNKWSIEYIIDKKDLRDTEKARVIQSRLIRHMNIYKDILGEREQRFSELLRKSLNDTLTPDEMNELDELDFKRQSPILASELEQLKELEDLVKKHKEVMDQFKQEAPEEGQNGP